MTDYIYDPLTEYINVFRDRFKKVTEDTFEELVSEAKIDIDANRKTCRQFEQTQKDIANVKRKITCIKVFCIFLWVIVVSITTIALLSLVQPRIWITIIIMVIPVLTVLLLLMKVHPFLRKLKETHDDLSGQAQALNTQAWEQMQPLNRLYDWDVLTRMITKTVPGLEFDPYFTAQRLADLKVTYDWDDSFSTERSVIFSHSGLINGNPFVICRTRKMEMGSKIYTGSKTIHWTTQEKDKNGKWHTVSHSQTLIASYEAPYPEYPEKVRLIYGNTAASNLVFNRKQSGLAGKERTSLYKRKMNFLRKKARDLVGADYAMLTNEEFETCFDTSNRNNNVEFAVLFTPVAQESMLNLLKDHEAGYGDDFDFDKNNMINTIEANHMQELSLDMNPCNYQNFDFDKAKHEFYELNSQYFRAIYFCLAPILCIPVYQHIRPQQDIYGHDMKRQSAFWEHEALANFWGQQYFMDPSCVTQCILKTSITSMEDSNKTITVFAHGFRVEKRIAYFDVKGNDGQYHSVPVQWDEYLPVTGTGNIYLHEDNDLNDEATQQQRLSHINDVLSSSNLSVYRRHIASKI